MGGAELHANAEVLACGLAQPRLDLNRVKLPRQKYISSSLPISSSHTAGVTVAPLAVTTPDSTYTPHQLYC